MKKKIVAMMLSAMLAVSALAGCGDSGTDASANAGRSSVEGSPRGAGTSSEAGSEGQITLKVMLGIRDVDSLTDPSEMPAIQRLEEQTGIRLEWEMIKAADWPTKLNLMFASNEYPDIIITPNTPVDQERPRAQIPATA